MRQTRPARAMRTPAAATAVTAPLHAASGPQVVVARAARPQPRPAGTGHVSGRRQHRHGDGFHQRNPRCVPSTRWTSAAHSWPPSRSCTTSAVGPHCPQDRFSGDQCGTSAGSSQISTPHAARTTCSMSCSVIATSPRGQVSLLTGGTRVAMHRACTALGAKRHPIVVSASASTHASRRTRRGHAVATARRPRHRGGRPTRPRPPRRRHRLPTGRVIRAVTTS